MTEKGKTCRTEEMCRAWKHAWNHQVYRDRDINKSPAAETCDRRCAASLARRIKLQSQSTLNPSSWAMPLKNTNHRLFIRSARNVETSILQAEDSCRISRLSRRHWYFCCAWQSLTPLRSKCKTAFWWMLHFLITSNRYTSMNSTTKCVRCFDRKVQQTFQMREKIMEMPEGRFFSRSTCSAFG